MRQLTVGALLVLALAGCGWSGTGARQGTGPTAASTVSPTVGQTAGPTPLATAIASSSATADPAPSADPTGVEPSLALPPDAILALPDGSSQPGTLGTFSLDDHGTDVPWPPAFSLPRVAVTVQGELTVRFADGTPIGFWQAGYAAAEDETAEKTRGLGEREAESPPLDAVSFPAPPPGAWVVSVRLRFADGRGDATYYWQLAVT